MFSCSLITIKRSDVPEYLHPSELYLSFSSDDHDDEISVPSNCMEKDHNIRDVSDLEHLLITMRFWILDFFPNEVADFVRTTPCSEIVELFLEFDAASPSMLAFIRNAYGKQECNHVCQLATAIGKVDLLDFLGKQQLSFDIHTLRSAAQNGHANFLSYCYPFLRCSGRFVPALYDWRDFIRRGCFGCIPFLVENGVPVEKFLALALQVSSAECLKYLHENFGCNCWSPATMAAAARAGKVKLVQGLHELGCPWDESAYIAALRGDSSDCLQYLIDQRGVPISEEFRAVSPDRFCRLVLMLAEGKVEQDNTQVGSKRDMNDRFDLADYYRRRLW